MSVKINLPKSGMGIEEGTLIRWLRKVGDRVTQGEILAEVETAKATQEIESPADGVLVAISVAAGQTVPVNTELGVIDDVAN
jgi:pyruvate/2-oxoglutarate dehydrogenase complex dihydrolipoamide acyltransferase (E2) component